MSEKNAIEAALFAAGEAVELDKLAKLVGKKQKTTLTIVEELILDYETRDAGLEIIDLGKRYVMQVKPQYSDKVRPFAPKEMTAPLLRTLSMIAYHQPVIQSDIVDLRGNTAYDHIKELIGRGLVEAEPQGRSKILTTTLLFADYFNLEENNPEAIRKKIMELSREQSGKEGLDRWLGRRYIGFTPMYESLAELCGIKDFKVVNAYSPTEEDLDTLDTVFKLIISKGYTEKVSTNYAGEIIEAGSTTFDDIIGIMEILKESGDPEITEQNISRVKELREEYVSKAMTIELKAYPATEMVSRILNDLHIGISPEGVKIAPDYGTTSDSTEIDSDAALLIPTHKSIDGNIVERVSKKYETIINGLKNVKAEGKSI
ncbi:segregation and condensation protein B [Methanohalophilus levihalophilus]|uniref:SMC-Scp complex subunit ScpB n=1 Tax=Methanohalophilus levihalophilus TaxID=1431282 RepID=UPI001AE62342|nr:SMC-Scp complex subunit ScpB [Methanohalophilus levihalophilus]MBP2030716.1 segregation and condensation protein B [Methanohalophilus levihalophilus]